jgi:citrate lyase subunit beta/citryl-CoA lyase
MSAIEPLRRSLMYLSGAYPDMLKACPAFAADMFCFDLEDGAPPSEKIAARERIAQVLRDLDPIGRERLLRVNGLDTPWGHDDLRFAASLPIEGLLLPKVEGAAGVQQALAVLDAAGAPQSLAIWCLIETPMGVLRAEEIATASPRIAGFVIGGMDLIETTRTRLSPQRLGQLAFLSQCVLVARAYGLAIIDAIHPNYKSTDGLEESCRIGIELGFDGKSVVTPASIGIANAVFGPSADEVAHARELAASAGDAADGYANMHLQNARRLLARADHIAAQDKKRRKT